MPGKIERHAQRDARRRPMVVTPTFSGFTFWMVVSNGSISASGASSASGVFGSNRLAD